MYVEWRNGAFKAGRDMMRGPRSYHLALSWNNRERLTGAPTPEGEIRVADWIELVWEWPRFRGLRLWRYHMPWRETQPK